jgi:hypothetical protein
MSSFVQLLSNQPLKQVELSVERPLPLVWSNRLQILECCAQPACYLR